MDENEFWYIIDKYFYLGNDNDEIRIYLENKELSQIIDFKNILLEKMNVSYVFPLLEANFVISSYVSDDGFADFRAWLVSKGSQKFYEALKNPETIAIWLEKDDIEQIEVSEFRYVADEAFLEAGGSVEEFEERVIYLPDPNMIMDWPDNKEEYSMRFPNLVEKFWNQDLINEYHSE
nr:DUF4240 domain-containing protein [uncultured Cohaesibacter sp.]